MDRNILSVAMIYTNYDPKPHPPGGNIRPVIQATNYIKLHRPLRHPTLGHFQHHAFKRRKYVSPDYDFQPREITPQLTAPTISFAEIVYPFAAGDHVLSGGAARGLRVGVI